MVALVTAIQIALEWALFRDGLFGEDPAAAALLRPLSVAWLIGIAALAVAVVHQDPIPGVDQDWLIRPLKRTHLLAAKLAFVILTVSVPMFAANLADALANGFALLPAMESVLSKELFGFACFLVPVMALAATTRNMTELIIMGAALVVVFALSVTLGALFFGARWCPTCNSGMSWLQHIVQHVGILAGSAVILGLQYFRRQSAMARAVALAGAVALVFTQLTWHAAFAIEQRIAGGGGGAGINLELDEFQPDDPGSSSDIGAAAPSARQATQMLAHGHVGQAVEYLRRRARPGNAPVAINLPIRATGLPADELLLADRTEFELFDVDGSVLYRGDNAGALAGLLTPVTGRFQTVEIPGQVYRRVSAASRLRLEYSLTRMQVSAEYKLAATDGELQSDSGFCATTADRNAVYLRCKTLEQSPFCYSATLYGSGARHNPEVLKCTPDYRRHMPAFKEVVRIFGVDLPLQDRNGVAIGAIVASELGASRVLLRIYGERDHFKRTLSTALYPISHP